MTELTPRQVLEAAKQLRPALGLCMNLAGTELESVFPQDRNSDFQIYIQSLPHYNAGVLVGAWLDVEGLGSDEISEAIEKFLAYLDKMERESDPKGYVYLGPVEEYEVADYELPFKFDDLEDLAAKVEICADDDGAFLLKAAEDCGIDWEQGIQRLKDRILWRVKNNVPGCMSDARQDWAWEQLGEQGCPERFRSWIDLDHAFKELIDGFSYYYDTGSENGLVIFD